MSTAISHRTSSSRYIGRVGTLAAALGIGVMLATSPGIASATPAGSPSTPGDTTNSTGTTSDTGASTTVGTSTTPTGSTSSTPHVAAGVTVDSRGAAKTTSTGLAALPASTPGGIDTPSPLNSQDTAAAVTAPVELTAPTQRTTTWPKTRPGAISRSPLNTIRSKQSTANNLAAPPSTPAAAAVSATSPGVTTPSGGDAVDRLARPATIFTASALTAAHPAKTAAVSSPVDDAQPATLTQSATPTAAVAPTATLGTLAGIVNAILSPFSAANPSTPAPAQSPVLWTLLAWVRRNFFNQAPVIDYDPTATTQTGQTIAGNIGATDPENDPLGYTITQQPVSGTVTIDQATGNFTYTPDDINYTAPQNDSFTVSVTDGKFNFLSFWRPHADQKAIGVTVLNPTIERTIVPLPAGFTDAAIPRFAADGQSLNFSATPPDAAPGARREIYTVNVDGTGLTCLTCGLADPTPLRAGTTAPRLLSKPVPFEDGTGRILMQSVDPANGSYTHVVYEPDTGQLVRILTPAGKPGVIATDPQREMRISPDGTHVLFSQIQLVPNPSDPPGFITAVPVVGTLTPGVDASGNKVYNITDARVVYPVGEGKQFTHDGKGVIILGGLYESGNVDDIVVDLATGQVTRLTGNLDYDEDTDLSPNNQWLAIDSTRDMDALTPVTRIVRPAFLPLLIQGSVYGVYAGSTDATNISNQPWLVAVEDDLNRENGIPLFVSDDPTTPVDEGDNWVARSMPSWNADGTAVAFWEADTSDPTGKTSRLVVANVKYTTSVGTAADKTTPTVSSSLPTLTSNTPTQVTLPPAGTVAEPKIYNGSGGSGTAAVSEQTDAATGHIVRTVTYTNYVNDEGMILNGTEWTDQSAAQNTIHYVADIQVTGTHTGYLKGDVIINKLTRSITPTTMPLNASSGTGTADDPGSMIRSQLDNETKPLVLDDPVRVAAERAAV
ncbi:MAG TPA: hypothetical protein VH496_16280 [Mycobacterium sp.]